MHRGFLWTQIVEGETKEHWTILWYDISYMSYPRVREGLQWLYVGIVLTDHIQSTFRKSSIKLYIFITTWKFFQTKHRNFLPSFTFLQFIMKEPFIFHLYFLYPPFKSWWLTTTESFWKFAVFFSLHSDSLFTLVQGKTNGIEVSSYM